MVEARQHLHLLGATGYGSGKSTLIARMILDDVTHHRGPVVNDPKGDTVTDILDRLPMDLPTCVDQPAPRGTSRRAQQAHSRPDTQSNISRRSEVSPIGDPSCARVTLMAVLAGYAPTDHGSPQRSAAEMTARRASPTGAMSSNQLTLDLGIAHNNPAIAASEAFRGRPHRRADCYTATASSVATFHRAFNLPIRQRPTLDGVPAELLHLRVSLLDEETAEYSTASAHKDIVAMADALADIVYVAYGAALSFGIDLDAVIAEVHRSNMSKLDSDGRPIHRSDGKVLKSPRYARPDVRRVLSEQLPLPFGNL